MCTQQDERGHAAACALMRTAERPWHPLHAGAVQPFHLLLPRHSCSRSQPTLAYSNPQALLTLSYRSTEPTTTALGATQAVAAKWGILLPSAIMLRWRIYQSSATS